MKEVELAAKVVAYLEEDGWDVYQEVDGRDIVAVSKPFVWIVECKVRMGFDVLEQAIERQRRRNNAHWVYVATPYNRNGPVERMVLEHFGIGWLGLTKYQHRSVSCVRELVPGRMNRRARVDWIEKLRPEHKTHCKAGSPSPRQWTEFKETCKQLVAHVATDPGCSVRDAVKSIKHHYSTGAIARARVSHYVRNGVIQGVRLEREGKTLTLYPTEKPTP